MLIPIVPLADQPCFFCAVYCEHQSCGQVLGRSLVAGGFMGPTILGLQRLDLTCGLTTWRSLRNQYQQLFAPAGFPKIELEFRINQFAR